MSLHWTPASVEWHYCFFAGAVEEEPILQEMSLMVVVWFEFFVAAAAVAFVPLLVAAVSLAED